MEWDHSPFSITEGFRQADTAKKDDMDMTATERILELLYRNLQEVFGEGEAARRRAAIEEFYTDDCVLHVPDGALVGHDALNKFAGELRATHPHFAYVPHGQAQALHNGGILAELYVFLNPKLSPA
jgi:SnoaL-like domain